MLNLCGQGGNVPDVERYIRTIKDQVRSEYCMLLLKHILRFIIVHMVKNAVFWINSSPHNDSVSTGHSPQYILTGWVLDYNLHVRCEFGTYDQAHEYQDSFLNEHTVSGICLRPTGNRQGGHWFLNLTTGDWLTICH